MAPRPIVIFGLVIILAAIIGATVYVARGGIRSSPQSAQTGTSTAAGAGATSSSPRGGMVLATSSSDMGNGSRIVPISESTSTLDIPFPASTTIDTSAWHIYVDNQAGYSIEYPISLTQTVSAGAPVFTFAKNTFFHWPLLDDASVTVNVGVTCPPLQAPGPSTGTASFSLNGYQFTRMVGTDVGAGNRYLEVAYDAQAGGQCYQIYFRDHGANGASFYVDDASLIGQYDSQHDLDLAAVLDVLNGMVGTFHILAQGR